ncbi:putative fungal specific transcription factor domain-containing protein [Eutypa lata UCREL1]|uniref:Putative fungal specific transcription factor domain-containing protein n=1 Tax=Eutypa lata (strain UCR-EL1) TaxID=1287681 RepID=M7TS37_EUTLA|nr:putative fungal specific transcription factor domain-containing protein [Eutypa lata UCREL1]
MISDVSIDDHKWTNWKPEVFGDLFHRPIFRPLPSKVEALSLLKDYFDNFNCMFPLFHQPTFMHLVERQYSSDPYQGSGWWASLNCVLAIAYRLRVMSNLVPQEEDDKAWAHVKNALGVFSELTMRNTDLLSVQALLAISLFMQGTPNPQPSFVLIAAAIRLSHSIGLHKRGTGFNLNPIEIEQRKRVFWIAYMLDKDLCLRSGRPPAQDDDDMNVDLPDPDPADNIGNIPLADGKGKMNLFRAMCELTTIESRLYRNLYSTKATKRSDGERLQIIGELDKDLEDWKDRIPIDFRPEHEIKASHTPLIIHIAPQPKSILFSSVVRLSRKGDYISAQIHSTGRFLMRVNPLDARAKSDTRLMNLVVTFLSTLGEEAETGGIRRMLTVCSEFEHIARVVIDKAEKESSSKRKRKGHETPKSLDVAASQILAPGATPTYDNSMGSQLSPKFHGEKNRQQHNNSSSKHSSPMPSTATATPEATTSQSGESNGGGWPPEFSNTNMSDFGSFSELTGFGQPIQTPPMVANGNHMFQPLLPQDVWQLPMTLDYDWAETLGAAYPGFENGSTMQTDD